MDELAERFEAERGRLRGLAYRLLGSAAEADDAVQEAWLRLNRVDSVDNLAAWLTTVVSRVCLDVLRSRKARREDSFDVAPEPTADADPAGEVELADSVGRALLVVLAALGPAERIAFVPHGLFAVPFDRIGPVLDRTPVAAKKLSSRARHRVRGTSPLPPADLTRHRRGVDAFLAAARGGPPRAGRGPAAATSGSPWPSWPRTSSATPTRPRCRPERPARHAGPVPW